MKTTLIEENKEGQTAYNSLMVKPKDIGVICSDLSLRIISELVKAPACAMDVARKLEQHEQKIYYHLRRLEHAGIIKMVASEKRYGMTAKIYDVVSPVVAIKLYNDGHAIQNSGPLARDPEISKFLEPFIVDGKLNAKIIIGDPYPHGEYDQGGLDAGYAADLTMFLGNYIKELRLPCYKIDTCVREIDLNNNLIIIGNPKFNTISKKINGNLPVYFDEKNNWNVVSRINKNVYKGDNIGIIIKCNNPFNKNKKILLLAGKRTRGTIASIIAFTQHINELIKSDDNGNLVKIIEGFDKQGDGFIDYVKFIE
jgi:DNA-binding transcriptional ArsR family regulator